MVGITINTEPSEAMDERLANLAALAFPPVAEIRLGDLEELEVTDLRGASATSVRGIKGGECVCIDDAELCPRPLAHLASLLLALGRAGLLPRWLHLEARVLRRCVAVRRRSLTFWFRLDDSPSRLPGRGGR